MKKDDLSKIENSPLLDDNAKQKYKEDRLRYLKDKVEKDNKIIDNTLLSLPKNYSFRLIGV